MRGKVFDPIRRELVEVQLQQQKLRAAVAGGCGMIRVVIVQEHDGCEFFFSTDPQASVREILEAFADRAAIEQVFLDIQEVWGSGKQQLRYLWANFGAFYILYNSSMYPHRILDGPTEVS